MKYLRAELQETENLKKMGMNQCALKKIHILIKILWVDESNYMESKNTEHWIKHYEINN